jgi:Domain of unknown function (DUF4185)
MPAFWRLASMTIASAASVALVVPLVVAANAAADPCSVPTASPSARSASPSLLPKLPILHLPIGRMPAILTGVSSTPEVAKDTTVAPNTAARAAAAPSASTATTVSWVTGPNTNTYGRFGISGTDLGIMWDNGQTGANNQVLIAFGDTFGNCDVPDQEWRNNTLFRSSDRDLANGIDIPDPLYKTSTRVHR